MIRLPMIFSLQIKGKWVNVGQTGSTEAKPATSVGSVTQDGHRRRTIERARGAGRAGETA